MNYNFIVARFGRFSSANFLKGTQFLTLFPSFLKVLMEKLGGGACKNDKNKIKYNFNTIISKIMSKIT